MLSFGLVLKILIFSWNHALAKQACISGRYLPHMPQFWIIFRPQINNFRTESAPEFRRIKYFIVWYFEFVNAQRTFLDIKPHLKGIYRGSLTMRTWGSLCGFNWRIFVKENWWRHKNAVFELTVWQQDCGDMQRKTCFFKITFFHGDHLLFIENNDNLFVIS